MKLRLLRSSRKMPTCLEPNNKSARKENVNAGAVGCKKRYEHTVCLLVSSLVADILQLKKKEEEEEETKETG